MTRFVFVAIFLISSLAVTLRGDVSDMNDWKFTSSRAEMSPRPSTQGNGGSRSLIITGNGESICDGAWRKTFPLPSSKYARFTTRFRAKNIEMMARNVVAGIAWLGADGKEVGEQDFATTTVSPDENGWRHVNAIFAVPPKATQARIDLRLRWSANGEVEWKDAKLDAAEAPAARIVKAATIYHRPRHTSTAQDDLNQFAKFIDEAGAKHADIVCLPEGCTLIGRATDYLSAAESIPGPSTEFLGKCAAKNHAYIVAGIYERDGKGVYNTSVLIDRDGKLVGKYRKICLPHAEIDGGLAPGHEYPVFDTDFGKVGMMICWDVSYPEVARELAANGAEMILMPIWGGNETLCRARAIENQIPLVLSSYDLRSAVYDQTGEPKAQAAEGSSSVVMAELNLAEPVSWKWIGNWRSRIWLEGPVRASGPVESH